jgi:anti-sigma factor ChrR (cupin superfamily)
MQVDALTLTEYLLGGLDDQERAQVEAALASSPMLRAELRALAEVFGEVAAELPPELPSPSGRDRLLAAVAPRPRLASVVDALARFVDMTREAAAALLASVDEATRWHPTPWAGIRVFHIEPGPRIADAEVGFVHMAPGARFPWHGHDGDEENLVLQGALQVSDGRVVGAGEIYVGNPAVEHDFVALDGPDLILVAVLRCHLIFADGTLYGRHAPH